MARRSPRHWASPPGWRCWWTVGWASYRRACSRWSRPLQHDCPASGDWIFRPANLARPWRPSSTPVVGWPTTAMIGVLLWWASGAAPPATTRLRRCHLPARDRIRQLPHHLAGHGGRFGGREDRGGHCCRQEPSRRLSPAARRDGRSRVPRFVAGREFAAGMAEVVKAGLIADAALLDTLEAQAGAAMPAPRWQRSSRLRCGSR